MLQQFAGTFRLEEFFLGRLAALGVVFDRFGRERRRFAADMDGAIVDGRLLLREDFTYDDGATETRTWRIRPLGQGRYEGEAGGVHGPALGTVEGHRFRWTYDYDLDVGGGRIWRVRLDDTMFLQDATQMLNRLTISKWGLRLGEVLITIRRLDAGTEPPSTLPFKHP